MIRPLAELFFLALGSGISFFTPMADPKMTGAGFLKVVRIVSLVSLILALALHWQWPCAIAVLLTAVLIGVQKDQQTPLSWGLYILVQLALLMANQNWYQISTALFLGSVCYAMLLGHWYLVVPKMSEKPLLKCTFIIAILLSVKLALSIRSWMLMGPSTEVPDWSFTILMICMRIGWGLAIVGIMDYFTFRLVRMRSIQSATGILYSMTFFALIGELCALYFFLAKGMFL